MSATQPSFDYWGTLHDLWIEGVEQAGEITAGINVTTALAEIDQRQGLIEVLGDEQPELRDVLVSEIEHLRRFIEWCHNDWTTRA